MFFRSKILIVVSQILPDFFLLTACSETVRFLLSSAPSPLIGQLSGRLLFNWTAVSFQLCDITQIGGPGEEFEGAVQRGSEKTETSVQDYSRVPAAHVLKFC